MLKLYIGILLPEVIFSSSDIFNYRTIYVVMPISIHVRVYLSPTQMIYIYMCV